MYMSDGGPKGLQKTQQIAGVGFCRPDFIHDAQPTVLKH